MAESGVDDGGEEGGKLGFVADDVALDRVDEFHLAHHLLVQLPQLPSHRL